jgi:heat shock protein HslJ
MALTGLCAACQSGESLTPAEAPTLAELRNATYDGFDDLVGSVTLVDGEWEGEPYVEGGASRPSVTLLGDLRIVGDVDGDGTEEAVAFLNESTGGSGQLLYLVVVGRADGELQQIASAFVGDRIQIRGARVGGESIFLDVVRTGPEDAACCPGELATHGWTLESGIGLNPIQMSDASGRLSLETIGGTVWTLRSWAWEESAPAEPQVTLMFEDGKLVGHSGCNRYFATVTEGESPGEVSVGPAGATRMACPDAEMAVETRFLKQLAAVRKYGYMMGRLALFYEEEGLWGVMLFEAGAGAGEGDG